MKEPLKNDLILRVAKGEKTERPPVWLMRQAGRILPQYRALRAQLSGFKELVETPELACEVTIQPIDELDVDAAIIFSDILVIPEALGLPYEMIEKKGPFFPKTISSANDVDNLVPSIEAASSLTYVFEALKLTKQALNGRVPLIGFAGAPWTILAYMVEGSGSKTFSKAKKFLYSEPDAAHKLLGKIADTTAKYLRLKVEAGADMLQLFDSWAAVLSPSMYKEFAIPYLERICQQFPDVPVTVFSKGAWFAMDEIKTLSCNVIGLDWNYTPTKARAIIGADRVVQGNLDPCQLYAPLSEVKRAATDMLDQFGQHHIANLGHGVYPDTPLDAVRVFVDTVKEYAY